MLIQYHYSVNTDHFTEVIGILNSYDESTNNNILYEKNLRIKTLEVIVERYFLSIFDYPN